MIVAKTKDELFNDWESYLGSTVPGIKNDRRVIALSGVPDLSRMLPPKWSEDEISAFFYYLLAEYGKELVLNRRHEYGG